MWKNLDLNTDIKFRDIEIDQLLACSIEETLPFPRNKLTKKQKDIFSLVQWLRIHLAGASLFVHWLKLHLPNVGAPGSILGQGTRSHMPQLRLGIAKGKKKKRIHLSM